VSYFHTIASIARLGVLVPVGEPAADARERRRAGDLSAADRRALPNAGTGR
jgi:hypothetical protein